MAKENQCNIDDWWCRWDLEAVPDLGDKVRECEFFYELLSKESERNRFRWILSAFLNSAYSFFETSALTAYFRFTGPDGQPFEDKHGLAVLKRHIGVVQNSKRPEYVKTVGLSSLTKMFYDIRSKTTHRHSLSIMVTGASLPENFHIGDMKGEGIPAMSLCRDVLQLVQSVHFEINE